MVNPFTVLLAERIEPENIHVIHVEADDIDHAAYEAMRAYWCDETDGWSVIELLDYPFQPRNYLVHGVTAGHVDFQLPA